MNISYLLNFGSTLDLREMCDRTVKIITEIYGFRSCTIFLYNGQKDGDSKIFQCYGTTGLWEKTDSELKEIIRPQSAFYSYDKNRYDTKDVYPEHYTLAVIHYGINIIITDDLSSYTNEQFEKDTQRKIDRTSARYYGGPEKHHGPAMFIPLYTSRFEISGTQEGNPDKKRDVFGVVVITIKESTEERLKPEDIRLILSMTKKLSKIFLFNRFLDLLNKPVGKENLDTLIEYICDFSGSQRAALYRLCGSPENRQYLDGVCQFGDPKAERYDLPKSEEEYVKYPGYTTYVAFFKTKVIYNNEKERLSYTPKLIHSGKSDRPGKFLGIPVCYEKELMGVLRTSKSAIDPPFNQNEITLLISLANRIAPYLYKWKTEDLCTLKFENELETIFGKKLIERIKEIIKSNKDDKDEDFCRNAIKKNFLHKSDEKSINDKILDITYDLWEKSGLIRTDDKTLLTLKRFDEEILNELRGYRDHFTHQFQVFLLGYYIIRRIEHLSKNPKKNIPSFYEDYSQAMQMGIGNVPADKKDLALKAWLLTSTFHDIAVPVQEIQRWLHITLYTFFEKEGNKCVPDVPVQNIFLDNEKYFEYLNDLVDLASSLKLWNQNIISKTKFQSIILSSVSQNKDHGTLSSVVLRKSEKNRSPGIIFPSALAIALHKEVGRKLQLQNISIEYSKLPTFALLAFCDLIHEWGRNLIPKNKKNIQNMEGYFQKKSDVTLLDIIVTDNAEEIPCHNQIPKKIKKSPTMVYIYAELMIDPSDRQDKIDECRTWLNFINSKNRFFCVNINGIFIFKR
jgi:hypothetical protein